MERKLASIQKIIDIRPIEGADKIECATVLGWECVISKADGFKVGDLVVYIEIDSVCPKTEDFAFLLDRKYKVKIIKLKKQVSYGLIMPLRILNGKIKESKIKEDLNVTEILGVIKNNPQAQAEDQLNSIHQNKVTKYLKRYSFFRRIFFKPSKSVFPSFIKKTDETRIQNMPWIVNKAKDYQFDISEKLDGQSASYALLKTKSIFGREKYEFFVCSRNIHLTKPSNNSYWTIAKNLDIERYLHKIIGFYKPGFTSIVLQGEIIGEGIQHNKYKIKGYDFYAFNLIIDGYRFDNTSLNIILEDLLIPIKTVPMLGKFTLKDTVHECLESAKGKSVLCDVHREGLVLRSNSNTAKEIQSFKIINPDFLLKFADEDEE